MSKDFKFYLLVAASVTLLLLGHANAQVARTIAKAFNENVPEWANPFSTSSGEDRTSGVPRHLSVDHHFIGKPEHYKPDDAYSDYKYRHGLHYAPGQPQHSRGGGGRVASSAGRSVSRFTRTTTPGKTRGTVKRAGGASHAPSRGAAKVGHQAGKSGHPVHQAGRAGHHAGLHAGKAGRHVGKGLRTAGKPHHTVKRGLKSLKSPRRGVAKIHKLGSHRGHHHARHHLNKQHGPKHHKAHHHLHKQHSPKHHKARHHLLKHHGPKHHKARHHLLKHHRPRHHKGHHHLHKQHRPKHHKHRHHHHKRYHGLGPAVWKGGHGIRNGVQGDGYHHSATYRGGHPDSHEGGYHASPPYHGGNHALAPRGYHPQHRAPYQVTLVHEGELRRCIC